MASAPRWFGRVLGWFGMGALVGAGKKAAGVDQATKVGKPDAASKLPTAAKIGLLLVMCWPMMGASCGREIGIGIAEGAAARLGQELEAPPRPRPPVASCAGAACCAHGVCQLAAPGEVCAPGQSGCWHDPAGDGCDSCWVFAPTAAPTASPTATPTQQPTGTPVSSTPAPTPEVPLVSCMNLDEPPSVAVPIFTGQACQIAKGFVPVYARDGAQGCIRNWKCAVVNPRCDPGDDCSSPFRRIQASLDNGSVYRCAPGEGPGPQFICDGADRPGQEAYGRNILADRSIIVPEGEDRDQPWKRASICGPQACPTPAPATPTPGTPVGCMPTLAKVKVQNVDNRPNTRSAYGCHNPIQGDRFSKNNWCESGSTGLYEGNSCTLPGPGGPCDPLHMSTFSTICGFKEPNVVPVWTVTGEVEQWRVADNPHHVDVKFIPGKCYTICAEAPSPAFAADGSPVPVGSNTKTCAEHCY